MFLPIHLYLTALITKNCMPSWCKNYFYVFFRRQLILWLQRMSHKWNICPKCQTCWKFSILVNYLLHALKPNNTKQTYCFRDHDPSFRCLLSMNLGALSMHVPISSLRYSGYNFLNVVKAWRTDDVHSTDLAYSQRR